MEGAGAKLRIGAYDVEQMSCRISDIVEWHIFLVCGVVEHRPVNLAEVVCHFPSLAHAHQSCNETM